MEELQAKHRKEQRDLQSQITQKKKQASKKTRRTVNDECARLETELKARQAAELAGLSGDAVGSDAALPEDELQKLTLQVDHDEPKTNGAPAASDSAIGEAPASSGGKKPSRQKARLARRAAEQEAQARLAEEEAKNLPDRKTQERERMLEAMAARGLCEKEIRADGHCLYSAVADQAEQLAIPLGSRPGEATMGYKAVRRAAADYIERHEDEFTPFLEEPLEGYLRKIRETGEWGGQLELMALAKGLAVTINVLQDFGRVEQIEGGDGGDGREMWLGYYKHGFGLGEHYNSLRKAG